MGQNNTPAESYLNNVVEDEPCQHLEVTIFDHLQEGERQCVPCGQVVYWGN